MQVKPLSKPIRTERIKSDVWQVAASVVVTSTSMVTVMSTVVNVVTEQASTTTTQQETIVETSTSTTVIAVQTLLTNKFAIYAPDRIDNQGNPASAAFYTRPGPLYGRIFFNQVQDAIPAVFSLNTDCAIRLSGDFASLGFVGTNGREPSGLITVNGAVVFGSPDQATANGGTITCSIALGTNQLICNYPSPSAHGLMSLATGDNAWSRGAGIRATFVAVGMAG